MSALLLWLSGFQTQGRCVVTPALRARGNIFCPLMMWMIDAMPARPLFLLALHFGDFHRRKSEIHCADDAVHLL